MSYDFHFACIDCGQPAIAVSHNAKRCKPCQRIEDNRRAAARNARKRKEDPEWRATDRAKSLAHMKILRSDAALSPTTPRRAAAAKRRQLIAERRRVEKI